MQVGLNPLTPDHRNQAEKVSSYNISAVFTTGLNGSNETP